MTSGFDRLEQELLNAERRQAALGENHRSGDIPRRRRLSGAVVPVIGAVVAIVVGSGALLLTGGHKVSPSPQAAASAAARSLVGELGVLRRPQTAADRAFYRSGIVAQQPAGSPPRQSIRRLTRLIALPDDGKMFLYVVAPGPGRRYSGLGYEERTVADGVGACCQTARALRRPGGPGPNAYESGAYRTQLYFEIVPDGVSQVRWVFPRFARLALPLGVSVPGPHKTGLTVTVPVRDNIAAVTLPQRGTAARDTWYAANGRVIADETLRVPSQPPGPRVAPAVRAQLKVFDRPRVGLDRLPSGFLSQLTATDSRLGLSLGNSRELVANDGQTAYIVPAGHGLIARPGARPEPGVCVINTNETFCTAATTLSGAGSADLCSPNLPAGQLELEWLLPDGSSHVALGMSDGTRIHQRSGYNVYIARLPLNRTHAIPTRIQWTDRFGHHQEAATPIPRNAQRQGCAHP